MERNPHALAEKLLLLSEEFSRYSGELAKLTKVEGEYYEQQRPHHKSDTAVQRQFQASSEGVKMTTVELKLKSISKEMSAIKSYIEVLTNEAKGIY
jgi:hypothetical protein